MVQFRPKLFDVSSIKPDIMEEPPSGNLYFTLSLNEFEVVYRSQRLVCRQMETIVTFSDEFNFSHFPTTGRVYVWKQTREDCNSDSLLPKVKHRGGSVMV